MRSRFGQSRSSIYPLVQRKREPDRGRPYDDVPAVQVSKPPQGAAPRRSPGRLEASTPRSRAARRTLTVASSASGVHQRRSLGSATIVIACRRPDLGGSQRRPSPSGSRHRGHQSGASCRQILRLHNQAPVPGREFEDRLDLPTRPRRPPRCGLRCRVPGNRLELGRDEPR